MSAVEIEFKDESAVSTPQPLSDMARRFPTNGALKRHVRELRHRVSRSSDQIKAAGNECTFVTLSNGRKRFDLSSTQGLRDLHGARIHANNELRAWNSLVETDAKIGKIVINGDDEKDHLQYVATGQLTIDQLRSKFAPVSELKQLHQQLRDQYVALKNEVTRINSKVETDLDQAIKAAERAHEAEVKKAQERGKPVPEQKVLDAKIEELREDATWKLVKIVDPLGIRELDALLTGLLRDLDERKDLLIDKANSDAKATAVAYAKVQKLRATSQERLEQAQPLELAKPVDGFKNVALGEIQALIANLIQEISGAIQQLRVVSRTKNAGGEVVHEMKSAATDFATIFNNIFLVYEYIQAYSEAENLVFLAPCPASKALLSLSGAISLGFVEDDDGEEKDAGIDNYGFGGRRQRRVVQPKKEAKCDLAGVTSLLLEHLYRVPATVEELTTQRKKLIDEKAAILYKTRVESAEGKGKGIKLEDCYREAEAAIGYTVDYPSEGERAKIEEFLQGLARQCRQVQDGVRKEFNATWAVNLRTPAKMVEAKSIYDW